MNYSKVLAELAFDTNKNMANQLYERIQRMIISGRLPSGFSFPSESDLCEQLGVGRTTLREAYKALEANGYITRTKRGTRVNDAEKIAAAVPFSVALEESDYNDLIEFRAIIESQIAYLAAGRATEEHIENLRSFYNHMKDYCYDIQKLTYYDTQFHMELASTSQNQLLQRLMLMSCDVFASGVYQAFSIDTNENVKQALDSHEKILKAIEQHDQNKAQIAMFQHLNIIQGRGWHNYR